VGDGEQSVWDCTLIPIALDQGGSPDYVVLTCVEVTRPVLAREALEQGNRLKDTFLSMASHELRTPLTPLAAYVEVLAHLMSEKRRDADWEHQVSEVISKFRRQITYMSRLTEDLVDISRIRSGHMSLERKPVNLKKMSRMAEIRRKSSGTAEDRARRARVRRHGERGRDPLTQVVYNLPPTP
jgi:signal transduction histidine kinase